MRFTVLFVDLIYIALFTMCSNLTPESRSMEQINLSIKNLKRAYLDTAETGVILEILFYDPWLEKRDSVKFYSVELDENFTTIGELQRMDMVPFADTLLRKVIRISTDHSQLPGSFLYEVGAGT